jgi:hypothetical protein
MRTGAAVVVFAGLVGAAAGADEKPAVPAKAYELRVVAVGDTYHGIRFRPTTGESWNMIAGRWERLDEAVPPPPGDYDVTVIRAEALLALRIDRATGATWLLQKGKWNPVKEPAPPKGVPAPKPPGPGFALRHVILGNQLHAVRFHTKTGAAWHLGGDTFEALGELGKVPAGDFDLTLITGTKDWMGFRIDRKAGTTWILQANIWHEVTEPE